MNTTIRDVRAMTALIARPSLRGKTARSMCLSFGGALVVDVDFIPDVLGATEFFGRLDQDFRCIRFCCRLVINEVDRGGRVLNDCRLGCVGYAGEVEDQLVLK